MTAELSSLHGYNHGLYAIDGIYDESSRMAHTQEETSPWIQINLEKPALVRGVRIWNRLHESNLGILKLLLSEQDLQL